MGCTTQAVGLADIQETFKTETGLDFSFLFVLYQGFSSDPATKEDAAEYAGLIGDPPFPIMADGLRLSADATAMTLNSHPEMCALAPDMSILGCYVGHGTHEQAFEDIRAHAAR